MATNASPALRRFIVPPQFGPPWPGSPAQPGDRGRALSPVESLDRRRLARQLHDRVIQQVLAAGLSVDWCMGEVPAGSPVHEQLAAVKRLTGGALRELRSLLQDAAQPADDDDDLPDMLVRLLESHATPRLRLSLQVRGTPRQLPLETRRWLYRFAAECVFNAAVHANARRAAIRLRYADDAVTLSVADDGRGGAKKLRRIISGEVPGTGGGYHFGLADIAASARERGWTLRAGKADLGGVEVEMRLPAGQVSAVARDADD
jgi:signal transduction histidine kinase